MSEDKPVRVKDLYEDYRDWNGVASCLVDSFRRRNLPLRVFLEKFEEPRSCGYDRKIKFLYAVARNGKTTYILDRYSTSRGEVDFRTPAEQIALNTLGELSDLLRGLGEFKEENMEAEIKGNVLLVGGNSS